MADENSGFQSFEELLNHTLETAAFLFSAKPDLIRATCQSGAGSSLYTQLPSIIHIIKTDPCSNAMREA